MVHGPSFVDNLVLKAAVFISPPGLRFAAPCSIAAPAMPKPRDDRPWILYKEFLPGLIFKKNLLMTQINVHPVASASRIGLTHGCQVGSGFFLSTFCFRELNISKPFVLTKMARVTWLSL